MTALRALMLLFFSSSLLAAPSFVHCFDFGCKTTVAIQFSDRQWQQVTDLFAGPASSPNQERQTVRRAVAVMERVSGDLAGTHGDRAGNYPGQDLPGQHDCIDESTNTFQYLLALDRHGLLRWHRVGLKHRRIVWLMSHWTASIVEIGSEREFAVDSWYRDNGELPYIQPLPDWRRKRDFPSAHNPELATN